MLDKIDIEKLNQISILAGNKILEVYKQDFEIFTKEDKSPLTLADKKANEVIVNELEKHYPEIPILSEEGKSIPYEVRKEWEYFWLVDPLDGTKEFIKKNGEFTVNIALIHNGIPIAGVIYAPVLDRLYFAKENQGAFKRESGKTVRIKGNKKEKGRALKVVASRSHPSPELEKYLNTLKIDSFIAIGSSLKLCLVAEGKADIYPRLGPTMEWDTGAGHAILKEAGCGTIDVTTEKEMVYNKENLLNNHFIASS
ncbi:MAG: 3'(2'),5'-bisphosphate nucleotidase [Calditrichaeota bacterium]|nr:MAG: 3'(2'),5'-bisphosphate nucleotidase [Calditrichota bacterium]